MRRGVCAYFTVHFSIGVQHFLSVDSTTVCLQRVDVMTVVLQQGRDKEGGEDVTGDVLLPSFLGEWLLVNRPAACTVPRFDIAAMHVTSQDAEITIVAKVW